MDSTKKLTKEHKNILKMADIISDEVDRLRDGGKLDKDFVKKAIFFVRNYADKFHHAKEEKILFKEICSPEADMHCNPVNQMLFEHDEGRNYVCAAEIALEEGNVQAVCENLDNYILLIKDHIYKEDNILYPMSEEGLNDKIKKNIVRKFNASDKRLKQVENKCLKILKELSKK